MDPIWRLTQMVGEHRTSATCSVVQQSAHLLVRLVTLPRVKCSQAHISMRFSGAAPPCLPLREATFGANLPRMQRSL